MNIVPLRTLRSVIPGSERALDPQSVRIAPVDPDEPIAITMRLRPDRAIPDQYTGESREQFEHEHSARPGDIAKVEEFAHDFGLAVDAIEGTQRSVTLSGTAAQMTAAFGTDLARYRGANEEYRGRVGGITLPSALAAAVSGVFGLDDRATSVSHLVEAKPTAHAAPAFTPQSVAKAYDFPSGDGTGEHIAVISLGGRYDDRVQAAYCAQNGVPHVPFHVVAVDGGADRPSDPGPTGENMLDAETIGTLVPNADKTIYSAPNTDRGFLDAVATAMHDTHHNTAISISWGAPEEHYTPQAIRAFNELFKEAKAMGINVFCAAGDNGSDDRVGDGDAHTDFPSSSPSAIAAGGTKLIASASGAIQSETVWNELRIGEGATGGGVSKLNHKPAVQRDLPIAGRGVPDIAGNADPTTGYAILLPAGERGKAERTIIGGTSAVAPLYAALAARIEQNLGHPLGDFQKAIYAAPADDFHDITSGSNGAYKAGPGWDATTGRGSIDGTKLLHDIALREAPQTTVG